MMGAGMKAAAIVSLWEAVVRESKGSSSRFVGMRARVVDRRPKDKRGDDQWVSVVYFCDDPEGFVASVSKFDEVYIEGRLDVYIRPDLDEPTPGIRVMANRVDILGNLDDGDRKGCRSLPPRARTSPRTTHKPKRRYRAKA